MRLGVLEHGHRLRARWFLAMVRLSGSEMSDVIKTFLYRPEFFGRAILELSPEVMRGPSYWTAGEREFIARFTATLHRSPYCVRLASGGELDPSDPEAVRPQLAAALGFLEAVTSRPDDLTEDLAGVRAAKVPHDAILDALHVNLIWNIVNRLANAFDFQLREGERRPATERWPERGSARPVGRRAAGCGVRLAGGDGAAAAVGRRDRRRAARALVGVPGEGP